METVNAIIKDMEEKIAAKTVDPAYTSEEDLKVGVDLGTSNIVLTVLNKENQPVTGALEAAQVVKDGIVVDFINAVTIVKRLKAQVEEKLGFSLHKAATAIPPGISEGNVKVITNVVEACDFSVCNVIDEPAAAAKLLNIENGAVVDIGGGTTGISVIKNGVVEYSADEATGGHHLTLVVAGSMHLSYEEAEKYKKNPHNRNIIFPLVRPVIEKMAEITKRNISKDTRTIYLVGGTCCLEGIEAVFQKYTSLPAIKPYHPLLVTPIGIAMAAV
ncbi:ethanolamine utilization protein EutJ [Bacillaceae bacterium Marseille-Q3522]|nr:ethanolamine utilization protein EutJ [Bacillaceae bacterium Marseille-Q3522]